MLEWNGSKNIYKFIIKNYYKKIDIIDLYKLINR